MIAYQFRLRRQLVRQTGQAGAAASFGGLATGLFGVGCAACGTFVLSPALTLVGISGLIALLPFGGEAFGVLGVGMLGLSLVLTARRIAAPVACPIRVPDETEPVQTARTPTSLIGAPGVSIGASKSLRAKLNQNNNSK